MFNQTKLIELSQIWSIKDLDKVQLTLKKQAKYLKVSSTFLLKSYVVIADIKKRIEDEEIKIEKYKSKNIYINRYKSEIVYYYSQLGYGYLKLSNHLKILHRVDVSKSAIEHFIKSNNISRD